MEIHNVSSSTGKRTSISNGRDPNHRTQAKTTQAHWEGDTESGILRKVTHAKPPEKDAPNLRIKPRCSREQNLRRNNARKVGETGKNRRAKKKESVVRRKTMATQHLEERECESDPAKKPVASESADEIVSTSASSLSKGRQTGANRPSEQ